MSVLVYKLQWLISDSATGADVDWLIDCIIAASECCLGQFGVRFRKLFPTRDRMKSSSAVAFVLLWQRLLKFTTAPCECEHQVLKDEMASSTTGVDTSSSQIRVQTAAQSPSTALWRRLCSSISPTQTHETKTCQPSWGQIFALAKTQHQSLTILPQHALLTKKWTWNTLAIATVHLYCLVWAVATLNSCS